jgi:hypothetical protein
VGRTIEDEVKHFLKGEKEEEIIEGKIIVGFDKFLKYTICGCLNYNGDFIDTSFPVIFRIEVKQQEIKGILTEYYKDKIGFIYDNILKFIGKDNKKRAPWKKIEKNEILYPIKLLGNINRQCKRFHIKQYNTSYVYYRVFEGEILVEFDNMKYEKLPSLTIKRNCII